MSRACNTYSIIETAQCAGAAFLAKRVQEENTRLDDYHKRLVQLPRELPAVELVTSLRADPTKDHMTEVVVNILMKDSSE
jgi:hypothetical protein